MVRMEFIVALNKGKNQSAYMILVAYDYLRAAKLLWLQPNLQNVAMVNGVIAIEIILKSFAALPVDNVRKGTISEQYEIKGKKLHLLTELKDEIDPLLYKELRFDKHEYWFETYNDLFVKSRYPYEEGSRGGYTEIPIKVGIEMFGATIDWYKRSGNKHPWVTAYPDVPGGNL